MNIYWDIQNQDLLSANNASALVQSFEWHLRDAVSVTLRICQPTDSGSTDYTVQAPPDGTHVVFGLALTSALSGATVSILASQPTWTFAGTGVDAVATAVINLNTEELIAAMGGETEIICTGEFVLRDDVTMADRDSTQVTIKVKVDVNRLGQSLPIAIPALPGLLEHFVDDAENNCVRIINTDGETLAVFKPAGA